MTTREALAALLTAILCAAAAAQPSVAPSDPLPPMLSGRSIALAGHADTVVKNAANEVAFMLAAAEYNRVMKTRTSLTGDQKKRLQKNAEYFLEQRTYLLEDLKTLKDWADKAKDADSAPKPYDPSDIR